jgi:hypothetical protein
VCTERGCGATRGEPHLTTFDGRRYDFQAVGEFVATQDPAGGYAIQVRQQPYGDSKVIAVNASIAMDVNGDRVEARLTAAGLTTLVNGAAREPDQVDLDKGGQLRLGIADSGPLATVTWPDGSAAWVTAVPSVGLNLAVQPSPARGGHLEGLLGNFDGKVDNDIRPRGGNPVTGTGQPPYAALYPGFANSWRVDPKASLFTYPPGKGTESYTQQGFPQQTVTAAGLPNRAAAEAVCQHYGVTDRELLEACILDVGLTGQAGFAATARAGQLFETGVRTGQPALLPATADIYLAGAAPVPALPGGAGTLPMRIAIDPASTHLVTFPEVRGVIGPWASNHDGPDGGTEFSGTDITPFNGISGVLHKTRSLFLVGVFLPKPPLPSATASKPDLSDRDTVVEFKPVLGEVFYIGDGHTPDGTVQRFLVPAGATNLYVGFADASVFRGGPGSYGDNTGALTVKVTTG